MPLFFAIVLMGIVQGLTEFLPVSSSGHLVLISRIFGVEESLFLSIILHVATLFSVIFVFRKKILYYLKRPFSKGTLKLLVATIPTCVIVVLILPILNQSFEGAFLPFCFMITAFVLGLTDLFFSKKTQNEFRLPNSPDFEGITYRQAIFMGIAQGFAVFPGISRSGSTICAGMLSGGEKESVAEFSFLMSVPIILLSLVKEVYDISKEGKIININIPAIIISFLVALIIGVFAIKFMIKLTKKANFLWFSIYLSFLTIVTLFV